MIYMRKAQVLAAVAALMISTAAGLVAADGTAPPTAVRKAPEFVIESPKGKQTLLSSYRGKDVVLAFMFTTCSHCQKAAVQLAKIQDEYGAKGVQILGATFDKEAKTQVDQFVRIFGINFPCGYSSDTNVLRFLGLAPGTPPPFVPMFVFIDKTGMIRSQHLITGDDKKDEPQRAFFDNLNAGIRAELDKMLKSGPATSKK
jgi:peroxiredoxin